MFTTKKKILYKDWIYEWLLNKKHYIKESTYANYSCIVLNHLIPELGNYCLNSINNKTIQQFILNKYENGRLDNSGSLSDKTIKDITMLIKTSFKSAIKDGLIDYINLDFCYPKCNQKNKIYILSKRDQKKIIDYCYDNTSVKNMGIVLALYSGIRIGELCALKWKDIDFKKILLLLIKLFKGFILNIKTKMNQKLL